jgi:single-strand DNA-binding protein
MSSVNRVTLIGRLGQDPELRYTTGGAPVVRFSLATSDNWSDKSSGEKKEKTQWHNVVAWSKLAEICSQYLAKGRQVYVDGRIEYREYTDKDGNKRKITEIIARDVQILDTRSASGGAGSSGEKSYSKPDSFSGGDELANHPMGDITDDDIPF